MRRCVGSLPAPQNVKHVVRERFGEAWAGVEVWVLLVSLGCRSSSVERAMLPIDNDPCSKSNSATDI